MRMVRKEQGFVLITALMILSLMTLLMLGTYFAARSATQTSAVAQSSTEAYYYAETAVNYISWALANDAEFDHHTYNGVYVAPQFADPSLPLNAAVTGDYSELVAYPWNPGPVGIAGSGAVDAAATAYTQGQVMYFDNSPIANRSICFESAAQFPNCIDVAVGAGSRVEPVMHHISSTLPRYIKLEIAPDGSVVPSIPALPHHVSPVIGQDAPENGAIVWLTASDPNNPNIDVELYPLDPKGVFGGISPSACDGGKTSVCPCTAPVPLSNQNDPNYSAFMAAQACDANTGKWISHYGIVAYAIGYVHGRPSRLLRSVIR